MCFAGSGDSEGLGFRRIQMLSIGDEIEFFFDLKLLQSFFLFLATFRHMVMISMLL